MGLIVRARRSAAATGTRLIVTNPRGIVREQLRTLGILDYLTQPEPTDSPA